MTPQDELIKLQAMLQASQMGGTGLKRRIEAIEARIVIVEALIAAS
jgi:hypothetical protein